MQKGLHAPGISILNIFVSDILEYINAEGASCPGNKYMKYFL
jgi:hypothetical protein